MAQGVYVLCVTGTVGNLIDGPHIEVYGNLFLAIETKGKMIDRDKDQDGILYPDEDWECVRDDDFDTWFESGDGEFVRYEILQKNICN